MNKCESQIHTESIKNNRKQFRHVRQFDYDRINLIDDDECCFITFFEDDNEDVVDELTRD